MPFSATRDLWLVLKARDEASRAMGAFSRDIRMVGDSVRVANLMAARSAAQNHLAIQRMTGASQQDILVTQRRIQQLDDEIGRARIYRSAMEEQRVSAQRLSSALQGAAGTATAVGTALTAAGIFGLIGLKRLIDFSVEYERQSQLTATQVDKFAISLKDIEKIGLNVARAIGVPFQEIQPALFDIFSSMEVGAADAEKLLMIFSKAAVAGQTNIQNASKATIGILNAFHLPLTDINHLMDVQFLLVKEGIGTYEEWTQRIGLVTPSAVRAGQSVDMMVAALAASTRMGISAARSGTAVSRAMDAFSNPAAIKAMKQLGVNAVDAQGNFRPFIDVLFDFRKAIQDLPEAKKVEKIIGVFKGAGGTIEARRFLQNMLITPGNLELFQQIFNQMGDSVGTFEQAYSMMADTTATKSQLVANKWDILKVAMGNALAPAFLRILDLVGKILDKFNNLSPSTQAMIMKILALSAVASVVLGIFLLLVGVVGMFGAAIVTAGASVFYIVGGVLALIAALAAFTIGIVAAWKNSKGFRDVVAEIADLVQHLWKDVIVPFAKDVKDSFEKYVLPPLQDLRDVIEQKILPVVKDLIKTWKDDWLPAIKDIAGWIGEHLNPVFKAIGDIIENQVIPAIQKINAFYQDHKKTINEIIKVIAIAQAVMLALAVVIGVILAVAIGGPIVGIIAAFVLIIGTIVFAVIKTIEIVKDIINWFKNFGDVISAVGDFIAGIWDDIAGFFQRGLQGMKEQWQKFWNSDIGQFLQAVWNFITGIFDVAFAVITGLWNVWLLGLKTAWDAIWGAITGVLHAIWDAIGPFLTSAWNTIYAIAKDRWTAFKNFFMGIWNAVTGFITDQVGKLVNILSTGWDIVKTMAMDKWNGIKDFFTGLFSFFFDIGGNLIKGIIDGMTSKLNELGDKLHGMAKKIRDFFPHSPAKTGPLAGRGGMYYAGQNLVTQLQDGIDSKMAMVGYGSSLLANAAGTSVVGAAGAGGGKSISQNIVVNTQELNPRRQAAELGWLLAGSM